MRANDGSPPCQSVMKPIAGRQGGGRFASHPLGRGVANVQAGAEGATHVGYPLTPWTLEQNLVSWTQSTFTTYAGGSSMPLYLSASSFQAGCNLWQWPHLHGNSGWWPPPHHPPRSQSVPMRGYGTFQNMSHRRCNRRVQHLAVRVERGAAQK